MIELEWPLHVGRPFLHVMVTINHKSEKGVEADDSRDWNGKPGMKRSAMRTWNEKPDTNVHSGF